MMKRKLTFGMLTVLALTTACTSEEYDRSNLSDVPITFSATVADDWNLTRSAMQQNAAAQVQQLQEGLYLHTVTTAGFESDQRQNVTRGTRYVGVGEEGNKTFGTGETFYVSGYRYARGGSLADAGGANFLNNAPVTNMDGIWKTSQTYYMPTGSEVIDFFAWFAPQGTSGVTPTAAQSGLLLDYAVPLGADGAANTALAAQHPDLLTAVTPAEAYNADPEYKVGLTFSHQLTCVNFVMDNNVAPGEITEVAFLNVCMSGVLTVGGTWDISQGARPTETAFKVSHQTVNDANYLKTGDDANILTGLMMVPQSFEGTTHKLQVKIKIDGQTKTLIAPLTGQWLPGTTVTYKVSTSDVNVLRMGAVTYPTTWGKEDFSSVIKDDFADGDAIGVYAVDAEGNVVFENQRYQKQTDGTWATESTSALFSPSYTFFAYYPYTAAGLAHGTDVTSAEAFFASGISSRTPDADQGDATKLDAQDLQVGKSAIVAASTVNFAMSHALGLAAITMKPKQVSGYKHTYYYLDGDVNYRFEQVTATTVNLYPSRTFEDATPAPCYYDGTTQKVLYYVVNPAKSDVELEATGSDGWQLTLSGVPSASSKAFEVESPAGDGHEYVNTEASRIKYEMAYGDLYFSDGSIAHELADNNTKKVVGLVFSKAPSTKDQNAGWKHGYVMALKNAQNCKWSNSEALINGAKNYLAGHRDDKDGLTETNGIKNYAGTLTASNYPAAYYATTYVARDDNNNSITMTASNSGWYLPSTGQWFEICVNLGKLAYSAFEEQSDHHSQWNGASYPTTAVANINAAMAKATGYTVENIGESTEVANSARYDWYWTSTEISQQGAYNIWFNSGIRITIDNYQGTGYERGNTKTRLSCWVRPVLAF